MWDKCHNYYAIKHLLLKIHHIFRDLDKDVDSNIFLRRFQYSLFNKFLSSPFVKRPLLRCKTLINNIQLVVPFIHTFPTEYTRKNLRKTLAFSHFQSVQISRSNSKKPKFVEFVD